MLKTIFAIIGVSFLSCCTFRFGPAMPLNVFNSNTPNCIGKMVGNNYDLVYNNDKISGKFNFGGISGNDCNVNISIGKDILSGKIKKYAYFDLRYSETTITGKTIDETSRQEKAQRIFQGNRNSVETSVSSANNYSNLFDLHIGKDTISGPVYSIDDQSFRFSLNYLNQNLYGKIFVYKNYRYYYLVLGFDKIIGKSNLKTGETSLCFDKLDKNSLLIFVVLDVFYKTQYSRNIHLPSIWL